MIIDNLPSKVYQAVGLKPDSRFKSWCKWVDTVDPKGKDGYAFSGDFIPDGTIELEPVGDRVILACVTVGSNRYNHRNFGVAIFHPDGTLDNSMLEESDSTPGWALRLREPLAQLLESIKEGR